MGFLVKFFCLLLFWEFEALDVKVSHFDSKIDLF